MQNKRYTGIRLSEKDREMLEKIAQKYDLTISDVIRIAIKKFLENNETIKLEVSS
jgi:predicted DNA-binding protein